MKVRVTDREGFVLPVVIFALAIMGLLAVVSLRTADDEHRSSRALRESGAALYAAEAGTAIVRGTMTDTLGTSLLDSIGLLLAPYASTDLGWKALPGGGSYQAVIRRIDDGGGGGVRLGLTVQAVGAGPFGGRSTIFTTYGEVSTPPISSALFGNDTVTIAGGPVTGEVGGNGDLIFGGGGATVAGDAIVSGTVDDHAAVSGTVIEGAPPTPLTAPPCPATPFGPGFTLGGNATFDPITGDQSIGGSADAVFTSGTYYYHNLSKTGNSSMIVPAGNMVEIYLSGSLQVAGTGFINNTGMANSLVIFGCGPDISSWSVEGNADVAMNVYAPLHDIEIKGGGDRVGYYVGNAINKSGNGTITWDPALGQSSSLYAPVPGSWMQLLN